MTPRIANISILIDGMTCTGCETRIENALRKTRGIQNVKVSYANSRVSVTYDANVIERAAIETIIESLDYKVKRPGLKVSQTAQSARAAKLPAPKTKINQILGIGIIMAALFLVIGQLGGFNIFNAFPQAEQGMGYGLLFVIGLLTSLHCVAMCGGINLSLCVPLAQAPAEGTGKRTNLRPSILYNAGRVISYTVIGGIVGALGSVISFSGWAKGLVALVAGVFMVIMGLNMLNIFPWLRRFSPRMPKFIASKINSEKQRGSRSPLYIGLLNGLMPCGPLQAMQIFALSTGSPVKGALSMLFFSLGTVPLMFGLGALSSILSKKFRQRMVQVSALLVIILGIFMFQNGVSLSGLKLPSLNRNGDSNQVAAQVDGTIQDGVQVVTTQLESGRYAPITVMAGVPVRWTIQAAAGTITGCNNRLIIPEYNIEKPLVVGNNVIEFTPQKAGIVPFSCWMGMIRSKITVVAGAAETQTTEPAATSTSEELANAGDPTTVYSDLYNGNCCLIKPVSPGAAAEPEEIKRAYVAADGEQQATITVDSYGYSPQILVIQRGLVTNIKFDVRQLTSCNERVYIAEFDLELDLAKDRSLPPFTAENDFRISCWMNMLSMNVIVVDDLENVDLQAIQAEVDLALQDNGGCCG